jgi:hypothetical protein
LQRTVLRAAAEPPGRWAASMSWWTTKRGDRGTQELWVIDVDPMLTMLFVGLPILLLLVNGLLSTSLLVAGGLCVIVAKISLFRRGTWISWGPRLLSARCATVYKTGYALIACGAALRLVLRV